MCGIAGIFSLGRQEEANPAVTARRMADTLAHRGPDGADAWGDPAAGVGLGHRRLAIIDLSPTGDQPMHSAGGRYVITFNGEVYNFPALREELEKFGHYFRGTSDTEAMLAAIVQWGLAAAVRKFVGMFAFAVYDRQERTLNLVRDRLGVKPLYWTEMSGHLLFGSELRALMAHPAFQKTVDPDAVEAVVRYSYVPGPATIFRNVFKLQPGMILTARPGEKIRIDPYWRLADAAARTANTITEADAIEGAHEILGESVRARMISDVPLGAFLSGGTDSAAVVALMQALSNRPVKTFTIGFRDAVYDESIAANDAAKYLKTDHTPIMLEKDTALDLVNDVANWFDEPFADSSQLPTYLIARATREHVKVALSGDGGDELFAGYPKYDMLARAWRYAGAWPQPLRLGLGAAIGLAPEWLLRAASPVLDSARAERIGEKARRFASALAAPSIDEASLAIAQVGFQGSGMAKGASGKLHPFAAMPAMDDPVSRMQFQDTLTYLPDDILTKVDRCTMAHGLEAREPLLDHRLVEFIWSLPPPLRRGDGTPKFLLRSALSRYLPKELINRPKRGFSVPLGEWLRGPLRPWANDLFESRLDQFFNTPKIRQLWQRHVAGIEDHATGLWNVLMVQAWARRWL